MAPSKLRRISLALGLDQMCKSNLRVANRRRLPQMFPGDDLKWGLSFLINTKHGPAGRSAGTLSWCGLANTYFWVDPTKRVAGVICTQILPFVDPRVMRLYAQFESGVYKAVS